MKINQSPLPYFDERQREIDTIVIHCSADNPQQMIDVLTQHKLSSHYIIGADGEIWQCVAENKRAWHAGVSFWRGVENLNHSSIGIELESMSLGQENYPDLQIKSLIYLCKKIIKHYKISPINITAHSDIAPMRKPDPGLAFPWQKLAENKIGLWYDLADAKKINSEDVGFLLQKIGYDITNINAAGYAFCRHFAPQFVQKNEDINALVDNVYPIDFELPKAALPILKATAYKFSLY